MLITMFNTKIYCTKKKYIIVLYDLLQLVKKELIAYLSLRYQILKIEKFNFFLNNFTLKIMLKS